jgi:hypothetical protein
MLTELKEIRNRNLKLKDIFAFCGWLSKYAIMSGPNGSNSNFHHEIIVMEIENYLAYY